MGRWVGRMNLMCLAFAVIFLRFLSAGSGPDAKNNRCSHLHTDSSMASSRWYLHATMAGLACQCLWQPSLSHRYKSLGWSTSRTLARMIKPPSGAMVGLTSYGHFCQIHRFVFFPEKYSQSCHRFHPAKPFPRMPHGSPSWLMTTKCIAFRSRRANAAEQHTVGGRYSRCICSPECLCQQLPITYVLVVINCAPDPVPFLPAIWPKMNWKVVICFQG